MYSIYYALHDGLCKTLVHTICIPPIKRLFFLKNTGDLYLLIWHMENWAWYAENGEFGVSNPCHHLEIIYSGKILQGTGVRTFYFCLLASESCANWECVAIEKPHESLNFRGCEGGQVLLSHFL
jgi:hypothetical protein